MRALRFEDNLLSVRDVEVPHREGEALVRVTLSGICNTDVEIVRGYGSFSGTIGHEFVGVVESASDSSLIGQRVVGEINAGCGKCPLCTGGDPGHCPDRSVLGIVGRDGAHAEFLMLPTENLLPVPDDVSDERAVFTEPLAAAYGITEQIRIRPYDRVAVLGDGKLGLLCAQAVAATGAFVVSIGKHAEKLRLIASRGILPVMLEEVAKGRVREILGSIDYWATNDFQRPLEADAYPDRFDVVVEASGSESGIALALDLLRPRGTLVLKSTFHGATSIDASRIVVNEINVVGSRCGRFAPALELLEKNTVEVESMISEIFSLSDGVRAMERAQQPGTLKVLLRP